MHSGLPLSASIDACKVGFVFIHLVSDLVFELKGCHQYHFHEALTGFERCLRSLQVLVIHEFIISDDIVMS